MSGWGIGHGNLIQLIGRFDSFVRPWIMAEPIIPVFYLYGEPQQNVREGFVHVESLDDRSRPSEWTIQKHVHHSLNHIILIAQGGGAMLAEDVTARFEAPALLLVPAGVVHGFTWLRESRGHVMTIADSYLRHLTDRDFDLAALFARAAAFGIDAQDSRAIEQMVEQLGIELGWTGPGHRAAVESILLHVMVRALRCAHLDEARGAGSGRQAALVARLRERIEQRFRLREPVDAHARALGVSPTALRNACAHAGCGAPAWMLDQRALLEARRLLLYSNLSIAQVAYSVGFEDPAYFSRFFARHVGQPPRAYRTARGLAD